MDNYIDPQTGIEYSADKKILLSCPSDYAGELHIPEGVEEIARDAFREGSSITKIYIPASLKCFPMFSTYRCRLLSEFAEDSKNPIFQIIDGVLYRENTLIRFPSNKRMKYFATPQGITIIGESAFEGNNYPEEVYLSNSVTQICTNAFTMVSGRFHRLSISENIEYIETQSFDSCDIDEIVFRGIDHVKSIDSPIIFDMTSHAQTFIVPFGKKKEFENIWKGNLYNSRLREVIEDEGVGLLENKILTQEKKTQLIKLISKQFENSCKTDEDWCYVYLTLEVAGQYDNAQSFQKDLTDCGIKAPAKAAFSRCRTYFDMEKAQTDDWKNLWKALNVNKHSRLAPKVKRIIDTTIQAYELLTPVNSCI